MANSILLGTAQTSISPITPRDKSMNAPRIPHPPLLRAAIRPPPRRPPIRKIPRRPPHPPPPQFLAASLGAAASLPAWQGQPPRIVIAGAGMAGLSAALHLKDKSILAAVYEGSPRAGGRVLTARNLSATA